MNLTKRQLYILNIALAEFLIKVCPTGTNPEMKQDIEELCKLMNDEIAKYSSKTL